MTALIRAEFLKLRTTQVWFWLLLGTLALSALLVIIPLASSNNQVRTTQDVADMFSSAGTAYIVVFVLGVLGVTTEFRYQTITPTVLQTPSRWSIVGAKMISYALLGAIYGIASVLVQLAIAVPWLQAKNVPLGLGTSDVRHAIIAVFAVVALFGIVGLGVGALVRNQIVAVVVGLLFLLVIDNLLLVIPGVRVVWPYTPGAAASAILAIGDRSASNGIDVLPVWGGVVVLLLWAIVPALLGAAFSMNRDIT